MRIFCATPTRNDLFSLNWFLTIHQEVGAKFTDAASRIRKIGLETANLIIEGCDPDNIAIKLQEAKTEVEGIVYQCQAEASRVIDEKLSNVISKLNADIQDIRSTRTNRASACRSLEKLQEQCRQLIIQIHALT